MNPFADALRRRFHQFALDLIEFTKRPPKDAATAHIFGQLIRSGTGIVANYRAACRGRSHAEFSAKLGVALEEADETEMWLDLLRKGNLVTGPELDRLCDEAAQIRAILKSSHDTASANQARRRQSKSRNSRTESPNSTNSKFP